MDEIQKTLKYAKITIENIKSLDENSYFDVVDPMWGTISIYDGYDEYIQSAQTFTLEQRYLLAITWYFSEVCNGSHYQFLYNPTGIVWEDAVKGFKHFGMNEYAGNFQKVVDYCGGIGKPIFYLNEFAHMDKQTPTNIDKDILKEIILISSTMSDQATGIMLCKKIQESKLLPCNKSEIIGILETLAICGILETPEHKGYIHSFTPPLMRDIGDLRQSLSYPLNWWRG